LALKGLLCLVSLLCLLCYLWHLSCCEWYLLETLTQKVTNFLSQKSTNESDQYSDLLLEKLMDG